MKNRFWKKTYMPALVGMLSVGLVFSLGLHAIQVEHVHFATEGTHENAHEDEHSTGISLLGEYMHLADKKLLWVMFFAGVSLWTFLEFKISLWDRLLLSAVQVYVSGKKRVSLSSRIFDYVRIFLRKGTIHTKAY